MALKVLHVGKFYPPHRGGIETFLYDLMASQRAMGMEVSAVVHGDPREDDPVWLVRVPVQAQLVYAPLAIGFRAALERAIERFEPQVLHFHMPNVSAFWALTSRAAMQIPWVVHWHADVVVSRISRMLALAYKAYRPFEQALLERAERIVVTSPNYLLASEALSAWQNKCSVVPLGVALSGNAAEEDVAPVTWHEGSLRLLSIGRLTYYKGFETLIRAVAPMPDFELRIVGFGELREKLQALIDASTPAGKAPNITLVGEVSELQKHALLRSCDVFCLASRERTEAFGMVLLEAQAHARPCLVSDLAGSGMPWLVKESGSGWLVATEDTAAWQKALRHCAAYPDERLQKGQAGRHALSTRFQIKACAELLTRHYGSVLGVKRTDRSNQDVLIVIPARDEAGTIGAVVATLYSAGWKHVLVVDDHSSDDTAAIARNAGASVLQPVLAMGAWGAMQAGLRYGLAHGYTAVVTMDADGQHEVGELPILLAARSRADLVIGAFPERASRARRIAWRWFRHLAGFELRDLTSGFRYYSKSAMQILASSEATLLDYQDLGTLMMLRRAGLRIVEVPVSMNLRAQGKSRIFHSWFSVGRYMAVTTLLCLARWRSRTIKSPA
ncbi:MAG: glycosyl transferase [Rhodoferax sp.]|nr:glycosyl transferase [Rhodoferax sp.]